MFAQLVSPVTEVPLERLDEFSPKVRRVRKAIQRHGVETVLARYEQGPAYDIALERMLDDVALAGRPVIPTVEEQLAATLPVERKIDGDE